MAKLKKANKKKAKSILKPKMHGAIRKLKRRRKGQE